MKETPRRRWLAALVTSLALGAAAPLEAQQFPIIQLPPGYRIEKVTQELTYPTSIAWDDQGRMYVAEAGARSWRKTRRRASCASSPTR